jgi:hypothetical protein
MPIYQTNIWVCEVCNSIQTTTEEVSPYSDPVVTPLDGVEWDYIKSPEKLACPGCVRNHKSTLESQGKKI